MQSLKNGLHFLGRTAHPRILRPFKIKCMVDVKGTHKICLDLLLHIGFTKKSDINHTIDFEWPNVVLLPVIVEDLPIFMTAFFNFT